MKPSLPDLHPTIPTRRTGRRGIGRSIECSKFQLIGKELWKGGFRIRQNAAQDIPVFTEITADALFEKVRQIFEYSLHNDTISRFRRMMTIEQFRSPELAALYSKRYADRVLAYHAGIFRALIAAGELTAEDPDTLAMMYVAPVLTLIGTCDRQPERESECLEKLKQHVSLFFRMVHGGSPQGRERNEHDEKWVFPPVCGAKTRPRLPQRAVPRSFRSFARSAGRSA